MKVLIVGLGAIARKHILALKKISSDIELYALRREGSSIVEETGVQNIYTPIDDADFILISNPTSEHSNTIAAMSSLNKPLFIEKPLFSDLLQEELVRDINCLKIQTYIACNLRFLECIQFIKAEIQNKRVNEVNIYCGSYLPEWRPGVDYKSVYSANKDMGGGVHIDLIHEVDYATYLFGFPNMVRKSFRNRSSLNISAIDYANYLLYYKNYSVNIILNYYRKTAKRSMEIICEDGEYYVDLLNNTVSWNGKIIFESQCSIQDTYLTQMKFFINELTQDKTRKFNDINEAFKILKLCLED